MSTSCQNAVGAVCQNSVQFQWKLENFSSLSGECDRSYLSPSINFAERSWRLKLFPCRTGGWTSLYLNIINPPLEKEIFYTFCFKTIGGSVIRKLNSSPRRFTEEELCWGWSKCVKRSEILQRISKEEPSDCLIITVFISTEVSNTEKDTLYESASSEAKHNTAESLSKENQAKKKGGEKALEDIGKLLVSNDDSDVVVQVGDVQFKAHKNILSARTPVLSALFQLKIATNKIFITDVEPDIFKEFLRYIYTGDVQELTVQNVFPLYRVANKYLADDLKLQCLKYIQDTLCVETFCNAVQLALSYGETEILQSATNFASKNIQLIIRSLQWQNFNKEQPMTANEILIKSVGLQEVEKDKEVSAVRIDDDPKRVKIVNEDSQLSEKQGVEKISADIGKLLVSGDDSDVTVQVGDVQFQAHKLILAARTPVLAAMFKHETAEKISNTISISDCEPEVFKEFLHFIYTGTAQHLTKQNVFPLYRVADKYLTNDLKEKCLMYIQDTLCVETFCDSVQLTLRYKEVGLLQLVDDFATKNIRLIIRSVEWQKFNEEHPAEANAILTKSFGPP